MLYRNSCCNDLGQKEGSSKSKQSWHCVKQDTFSSGVSKLWPTGQIRPTLPVFVRPVNAKNCSHS